MSEYLGYRKVVFTDDELSQIYSERKVDGYDFLENEYVVAVDDSSAVIDKFCYQDGVLRPIKYYTIRTQNGSPIKARNLEQELFMDLLHDERVGAKVVCGPFGSGKSMLCTSRAIEMLERDEIERVIFVRNNVQVKDTDALGALPGSELDKVLPYVMPFADHCGGIDALRLLIAAGRLEVIPLGFLRGRSIKNAVLYAMECENLTKEHIQLMLGRIDSGSQLWLDGDIKQRDRVAFEKSRGIETMIERLKGDAHFGYIKLEKSERSDIARLADKLDN